MEAPLVQFILQDRPQRLKISFRVKTIFTKLSSSFKLDGGWRFLENELEVEVKLDRLSNGTPMPGLHEPVFIELYIERGGPLLGLHLGKQPA